MKGPGSPNWRKAGRPAKGDMPAKPEVLPAAIIPHDGLTREERDVLVSSDMKDLAEQIARRPGRNAQTQLAAVRLLLEYTTPKPAQKIDVQSKSTVDTKIEVVLVSASDGRRYTDAAAKLDKLGDPSIDKFLNED